MTGLFSSVIQSGSLNFQCTYLTSYALSATSVGGSQAHSVKNADGHSLADGFSMSLHSDHTFDGVKIADIKLGAPLFVEIDWGIAGKNIDERVKFLITDCKITEGSNELQIVKDNCYSSVLKSELIGENHLVSKASKFKFETFTFTKKSEVFDQELSCNIRLCLPDEEDCVNTQCDTTHSLKYTFDGK
jgi:hypothetical protein